VRLYDRLFTVPNPDDDKDGKTYRDHLNPESKRVVAGTAGSLARERAPEARFQLERLGYFVADRKRPSRRPPVFNRVCTLRDSWAKAAK
jgi:glutaminyl-tRNA synthetase